MEKLAAEARKPASSLPPLDALRSRMNLFIDYIATKKIIAPALNSIIGGPTKLFASSRAVIPHTLRHYMLFRITSGGTIERRRSTQTVRVESRCARRAQVITRHNFRPLKTVQKVEKLVCRLEASRLAVSRSCLLKGLFFHRKGRFDIDLRCRNRFMPEPQRDDRATNALLQKVHGHGVSQTVDGDPFLLQRRADFTGGLAVFV